ncbi:hypothetical protein DFR87_08410 [Metallosphaera hakonensis JCM 8857 = DSM 7519]|uniref:Uncharacterized protein n=1 Tax=Metallosphaera hakonensis JCM 8857 = DSM 7519 TaxID=1293036 RepID=A0A2U9IXA6_9CREN|nr:hypothetical protein [Metallosphaera hakonensis]AWS00647.1 hypothetical protein DFR87_08410 [Metallosphaera hakonensis JCM 8857 = DSM 7519]
MTGDKKKFYAIVKVDNLEVPDGLLKTGLHDHISSAVDEVLNNVRAYLKDQGIIGKFNAHIDVFAKEESVTRLIESIKTKIRA